MADKKLNVLVLSIYRDLAEDFVLTGLPDLNAEATIGGRQVRFHIFAGDPAQDPVFDELIGKADAVALVVRFLDVLSMDKIKAIYRALPDELQAPFGVFFLRDQKEVDFKISCPSCGQKLWLRDTDVNKRGRCPNCKKPFVIMSQQDHLKTQLMLPESVALMQTVRNNPETFQAGMTQLLEALSFGIKPQDQTDTVEALKNATMRIQIQEV
ncbi:MAG: hypothetical protein ACOYCD_03060 [Kiritimatiellia bacterium]|jgi:predicted RNA-binding Zn-ribbon protein involved in translation (DUF1610 family)